MKKHIILFLATIISLNIYGQDLQKDYLSGVRNMEEQQYNDAISSFTRALKANPQFEEAYVKRAACYVILEDHRSAVEDLNRALEINPNNAISYYNRGLAYKNLNELLKSINDFSRALELDPLNKYAFYNRALVKLRLDDVQNACLDLARAADMGVENATEIIKYTCKN